MPAKVLIVKYQIPSVALYRIEYLRSRRLPEEWETWEAGTVKIED